MTYVTAQLSTKIYTMFKCVSRCSKAQKVNFHADTCARMKELCALKYAMQTKYSSTDEHVNGINKNKAVYEHD